MSRSFIGDEENMMLVTLSSLENFQSRHPDSTIEDYLDTLKAYIYFFGDAHESALKLKNYIDRSNGINRFAKIVNYMLSTKFNFWLSTDAVVEGRITNLIYEGGEIVAPSDLYSEDLYYPQIITHATRLYEAGGIDKIDEVRIEFKLKDFLIDYDYFYMLMSEGHINHIFLNGTDLNKIDPPYDYDDSNHAIIPPLKEELFTGTVAIYFNIVEPFLPEN